jgi:hypothetical protein
MNQLDVTKNSRIQFPWRAQGSDPTPIHFTSQVTTCAQQTFFPCPETSNQRSANWQFANYIFMAQDVIMTQTKTDQAFSYLWSSIRCEAGNEEQGRMPGYEARYNYVVQLVIEPLSHSQSVIKDMWLLTITNACWLWSSSLHWKWLAWLLVFGLIWR